MLVADRIYRSKLDSSQTKNKVVPLNLRQHVRFRCILGCNRDFESIDNSKKYDDARRRDVVYGAPRDVEQES